jgi:NCS1 family nucleobase:cation symporter-1
LLIENLPVAGMKNVFPASTAMESADFLCFILFLLVSLPLIMIPPEHYRKPFLFTAFTSTITAFSIFFWSLARAKGGGPFINESVEQITGVPAAKGTYLVWYVGSVDGAN